MINHTVFTFIISFILCFVIIKFFENNSIFLDYHDGPQKFHSEPTPRVGGLGIFIAITGVFIFSSFQYSHIKFILFLLTALPIFIVGILEDFTHKILPKYRLLAAMFSGLLGIILLGGLLHRVDLPIFDSLLYFKIIAYVFTIIAVAGVSNAINIIDGYNGLVAVISIIIFGALAYVAFKVNDCFILEISVIMIAAIGGFFIWNYPFGKIFLGDGGAYFIGFVIAELSILLVNRHPEVSAWFPLIITIYPVFETIFSIYRRRLSKNSRVTKPDSYHLHQLIYKRVVPVVFEIHRDDKLARNSATSPLLWFICSIGAIPGILFWHNTLILIIATIFFCFFYCYIYRNIVRFKLIRKIKKNGKSLIFILPLLIIFKIFEKY